MNEKLSEQKAEEYAINSVEWQATPMIDRPLFVHAYKVGYIAGATEETKLLSEENKELKEDVKHKKIAIANRKARIKDLEAQIEKMKCCEICKHNGFKTCEYHNGIKNCKENHYALFELKR